MRSRIACRCRRALLADLVIASDRQLLQPLQPLQQLRTFLLVWLKGKPRSVLVPVHLAFQNSCCICRNKFPEHHAITPRRSSHPQ